MRASSHSIVRHYFVVPVIAALLALLGASLLMLVTAPRALACPVCVSPDKVTVSGEGISGVATITDPMSLSSLDAGSFMGFDDHTASVAQPTISGSGYELTRYFRNSGVPGSFWTLGFDHMRYYPGASGQPGYVYYEGPVSDEASRYAEGLGMPQAGRWYRLTASEDAIVQQALAAASGNPSTNDSAASPPLVTSTPPTSTQPPILRALASLSLPVAILVACLALLVAVVLYRHARVRRHPITLAPAEDTADERPQTEVRGSLLPVGDKDGR